MTLQLTLALIANAALGLGAAPGARAQTVPDLSRASPIAESYRAEFARCDQTDRFGPRQFPIRNQKGRIIWYGCMDDPSHFDALQKLPATAKSQAAVIWRSKLGLDLDGSWIACNKGGPTDNCATSLIGTRSANPLRASGHARPHQQAAYMTAPDYAPKQPTPPCRGGAVHT